MTEVDGVTGALPGVVVVEAPGDAGGAGGDGVVDEGSLTTHARPNGPLAYILNCVVIDYFCVFFRFTIRKSSH